MKTISLFFLTVFLTFNQCNIDDDLIKQEMQISYDSQDNVIKFGKNWVQSWNLEKDKPANSIIAVKHFYKEKYLRIQSETHQILAFKQSNFLSNNVRLEFSPDKKVLKVYYNELQQHVNDIEVFNFKIEIL